MNNKQLDAAVKTLRIWKKRCAGDAEKLEVVVDVFRYLKKQKLPRPTWGFDIDTLVLEFKSDNKNFGLLRRKLQEKFYGNIAIFAGDETY